MGHHTNDHHHEVDQQALYEGDQSKLYSGVLAHHHGDLKSPESKAHIKRIWMTTLYLTLITIVELIGGFYEYNNPGTSRLFMITFFFFFTLWKAYLIVKIFMHLGDEEKSFMWSVLAPLVLFSWFIIAFLYDANFHLWINQTFGGFLAN